MSDQNQNMQTIRSAYEDGINKGDIDLHADAFAPGYVNHYNGRDLDVEAFKHIYGEFVAGFPDLNTTIEDIFADGDKVAVRHTYRGTHRAPWMGIPPTGKAVTVTATDLYHMRDGKIVEEWVEMNLLSLLQQLGVIPTPGQPPAPSAPAPGQGPSPVDG